LRPSAKGKNQERSVVRIPCGNSVGLCSTMFRSRSGLFTARFQKKPRSAQISIDAQRSGRRGRRFESSLSDHFPCFALSQAQPSTCSRLSSSTSHSPHPLPLRLGLPPGGRKLREFPRVTGIKCGIGQVCPKGHNGRFQPSILPGREFSRCCSEKLSGAHCFGRA